ncbi:MAG: aldolase/citrate lyase family protein [Pseudomonadota bacterium]
MDLRQRLAQGEDLTGLFVKTPATELVEVLALSGLDFICLDTEHAAFDRRSLDQCLALARALDLPALVRVAHTAQAEILQALDGGAAGVVMPHVATAAMAADAARWCRFGDGGRGFAGSTRSAGLATRTMPEVLALPQPLVIAQIEDPSGVAEVEGIVATPGIDSVFIGAADLTVAYGVDSQAEPVVAEARRRIFDAAAKANMPVAVFLAAGSGIAGAREEGARLFFMSSDQGLLLAGARSLMKDSRGG